MNWRSIDIKELKPNPGNPRKISKEKFEKLVKSIQKFPEMLELRPIVVNKNMEVLGGNMRLKACLKAGLKEVPVIKAEDLTEEQEKEFIIKDNVGFGEWDWEIINKWEIPLEWGLDIPEMKETEKLSELKYESVYFEPIERPNIKLSDCLDMDKYNQKIKALDEFNLTQEQKDVLKIFAYRFIKIDFENVANYYFFNAGEEEKKAIERLRLVLVDNGINGFIEDDLLKVYEAVMGEEND